MRLPRPLLAVSLLGAALAVSVARAERAQADAPCAPPPPPSACAVVDACAPACPSPWTIGAGLYLSVQSGNTETFHVKGDLEVIYDRRPWQLKLAGYYVYGEQNSVRSSENGSLLLRGERLLARRDYIFAQGLLETDDFAALEYRLTPVAGYGRVLVKTARTELKAEAGGGVSIEKRDVQPESSDPIAWVAVHFTQKVMAEALFKLDLDVRPNLNDMDRTVSVLDAKFECPVCRWMSVVVGLRLRHEVEPPANLEELDTLFTVGLKLKF